MKTAGVSVSAFDFLLPFGCENAILTVRAKANSLCRQMAEKGQIMDKILKIGIILGRNYFYFK